MKFNFTKPQTKPETKPEPKPETKPEIKKPGKPGGFSFVKRTTMAPQPKPQPQRKPNNARPSKPAMVFSKSLAGFATKTQTKPPEKPIAKPIVKPVTVTNEEALKLEPQETPWLDKKAAFGTANNPNVVPNREYAETLAREHLGTFYGWRNQLSVIVDAIEYDEIKQEFVSRDGSRYTDAQAIEDDEQKDVDETHGGVTIDMLDEDQTHAIREMPKWQYACLVGGAGCGKTTVAKFIVDSFIDELPEISYNDMLTESRRSTNTNRPVKSILFVSFSGIAVDQMRRRVPASLRGNCFTFHKALGYQPVMENGKKQFRAQFGPNNKLPYDAVLVDEGGNVPYELSFEFLQALKPECRVYVMGDVNQLQPVGDVSFLAIAMEQWPVFELRKPHRSAGPLVHAAHDILAGKVPEPVEGVIDYYRMVENEAGARAFLTGNKKSMGFIRTLYHQNKIDPRRDAIIVPTKVGSLGHIELNRALMASFIGNNPISTIDAGYEMPQFAPGARIMALANDYDVSVDDYDSPLANGMRGFVSRIVPNPNYKGDFHTSQVFASTGFTDREMELIENFADMPDETGGGKHEELRRMQASHILTAQFGKAEVQFATAGQYRKLGLAYVGTGHKLQGSESSRVLMIMHKRYKHMFTREWFYMVFTRARHQALIAATVGTCQGAVQKQALQGNTIYEKAKFVARTLGHRNVPRMFADDFTVREYFTLPVSERI